MDSNSQLEAFHQWILRIECLLQTTLGHTQANLNELVSLFSLRLITASVFIWFADNFIGTSKLATLVNTKLLTCQVKFVVNL